MLFSAPVPAWNSVMVTTTLISGLSSRLTIVCSPSTICDAATIGSIPSSGTAAWVPTPLTRISNRSIAVRMAPGPRAEGADGNARHVVHAIHRLDREFFEQAILHHTAAAAGAFLGRLEDQVDCAGEVARFRQITRGSQQHGGVPVMAAAMHLALVLRAVAEGVCFLHVEGIHVRPQADGAAVVGLCALQCSHHAGAGQPAMHVVSELGELAGNEIGRAEFLECRFGMGVKVPAPSRHLVVKIRDPVDDGHRCTPWRGRDDKTAGLYTNLIIP